MIYDTKEGAVFVEREPRSRLILKTLRNPSPKVNERITFRLHVVARETAELSSYASWNRADCLRTTARITSRAPSSAIFSLHYHEVFRGKARQPVLRSRFREDARSSGVIVDKSDYFNTEAPMNSRAVIVGRAFFTRFHGVSSRDVARLSDSSAGGTYSIDNVRDVGLIASMIDSINFGTVNARDVFVGRSRIFEQATLVANDRDSGVVHSRSDVVQTFRADRRETARLKSNYRTRVRVR